MDDATAEKMIGASLAYGQKVILEKPKAEGTLLKPVIKRAARKAAQK